MNIPEVRSVRMGLEKGRVRQRLGELTLDLGQVVAVGPQVVSVQPATNITLCPFSV